MVSNKVVYWHLHCSGFTLQLYLTALLMKLRLEFTFGLEWTGHYLIILNFGIKYIISRFAYFYYLSYH